MRTYSDNPKLIQRSHTPGPQARLYLLLLGLLLVTRLLSWSHPNPTHPDEIAFVDAIGFPQNYPVHAPGYPFWVALGTIANTIGFDRFSAFKVWSLLASLAGPCFIMRLTSHWLRPTTAFLTAVLFGLLPVTWFHATTASTYVMASFFASAVATLTWSSFARPSASHFWLASLILSIGIFHRTDILLYLGPLLLYGAYCHRRPAHSLALLLPPLALAVYYYLAQALFAGAEVDAFARRSLHARDVVLGTSIFKLGLIDGLFRNGVKVLANLGWNMGIIAGVLASATLIKSITHSLYDQHSEANEPRQKPQIANRFIFLIVWIVPGLLFLLLMHCVQGYFLWILPAVCVLIVLSARLKLTTSALNTALATAIVLIIIQFTLYPWSSTANGLKRTIDAKIGYLSLMGLKHIDRRAEIHEQGDFWRTKAHD